MNIKHKMSELERLADNGYYPQAIKMADDLMNEEIEGEMKSDVLRTKGVCYIKDGNKKDAMKTFKQAASIDEKLIEEGIDMKASAAGHYYCYAGLIASKYRTKKEKTDKRSSAIFDSMSKPLEKILPKCKSKVGKFLSGTGLVTGIILGLPVPASYAAVTSIANKVRKNKVVNAYERAIELDPSCVDSYKRLITLFEDKPKQVVKYATAGLTAHPMDADVHVSMSNALKKLGKENGSHNYMLKAIELNPDVEFITKNFVENYLPGRLLDSPGDQEAPIYHILNVDSHKHRSDKALLDLASACLKTERRDGHYPRQKDNFKSIAGLRANLNPKDVNAVYDLAIGHVMDADIDGKGNIGNKAEFNKALPLLNSLVKQGIDLQKAPYHTDSVWLLKYHKDAIVCYTGNNNGPDLKLIH